MNRRLLLFVLVTLVLSGAMGLGNLATASDQTVIMANGGGPVPPLPKPG